METAGQENKSEMARGLGVGRGKRAPSAVVAVPCPCAPPSQAQVTKLGEEMSLRFLKREAKLCGFLQKSFLALEKVGACGLVGLCCVPYSPGSRQWAGSLEENEGLGEHSAEGGEQPAGGAGKQVAESPGAGRGACAGPAGTVQGGSSGWAHAGRLVGAAQISGPPLRHSRKSATSWSSAGAWTGLWSS